MNQVVDFINVNRDRYVDELKQYLAIPSISALPQHAADVRRAAEWTGEALKTAGRFIVSTATPSARRCRSRQVQEGMGRILHFSRPIGRLSIQTPRPAIRRMAAGPGHGAS